MAVNPALYLELSKALSRPSKAYRAASAALEVPEDAVKGYAQGTDLADKFATRRLANQTLEEALGGNVPEVAAPYKGLTVKQFEPTAKLLLGLGALERSQKQAEAKPGDNYNAEQTEAVASGDPKKLAAAFGGKVPRTAVAANTTARGVSGKNEFFGNKSGQIKLDQLPSNMPSNTAPGAAYQVKVAARQGKSLIAKATSPQNLTLAGADLARAVQRAAPYASTIGESDYGSSLPTIFGRLKQKLDSDPSSPDVPKLRKQLYDTFNELDKAATPWIENHLSDYESTIGAIPESMKQRQLGSNIPDIPFDAGVASGTATDDPFSKVGL